jgi:putative DNA primase/helicase
MEKLRAEHPGILSWAIEGCIGWQREGLNRPAAVQDATEEYLAEQDPLRDWIDECIEKKRNEFLTRGSLYASYEYYAKAAGEKPSSQKEFCERLRVNGWKEHKSHGERGFKDVTWKAPRGAPTTG